MDIRHYKNSGSTHTHTTTYPLNPGGLVARSQHGPVPQEMQSHHAQQKLQQQQQQQHPQPLPNYHHMNSPASTEDVRTKRVPVGTPSSPPPPPPRFQHNNPNKSSPYGLTREGSHPHSPVDERNSGLAGGEYRQTQQHEDRYPNPMYRPGTPPSSNNRMSLAESPRFHSQGPTSSGLTGSGSVMPSHHQNIHANGITGNNNNSNSTTLNSNPSSSSHNSGTSGDPSWKRERQGSLTDPWPSEYHQHYGRNGSATQSAMNAPPQHQHHPNQGPMHPQQQHQQQGHPHLQSAQLQHHQLQQQLGQSYGPGYPSPSSQTSREGPPLHDQRPLPPTYQHSRSSSFSDPSQPSQQQHPPLPGPIRQSTVPPLNNRAMAPPSPPRYPPLNSRPFSHAPQPPQFATNGPFQGGRELPALPAIAPPPRQSSMSLSSILGTDTITHAPRSDLLSHTSHLQRDSLQSRQIRPDFAPIKRSYTPDYPMSGTNDERTESASSQSPSSGHTLPSLTKSTSQDKNIFRQGHTNSAPPRPLSQPTSQTSPRGPQMPLNREHEMESGYQQRRNPSHFRSDSYPEPYYSQGPPNHGSHREQISPQRTQAPPFPSMGPMSQPPPSLPPQQTSPAYHHPTPTSNPGTAIPFTAYTTTMPASPFAITPALPTHNTLPALPAFDNVVDRRKQNLSRTSPPIVDLEREIDNASLRNEENISRNGDQRNTQPLQTQSQLDVVMAHIMGDKRVQKSSDDGPAPVKKDNEDVEMTGVQAVPRSDGATERNIKKRKHHHHHHNHHNHGPHHHHHAPHHHHPPIKAEATASTDNILAVTPQISNQRTISTPTSVHQATPSRSQPQPIPALPPKHVIRNQELLNLLKEYPSDYLGSMVYEPTVVNPENNRVREWCKIPKFEDRENCKYQVRIAAQHLSLAERNIVCEKRLLWGTSVYTDDSNIVAVLIHEGHIPAVHNGVETPEYQSSHDIAAAALIAQPPTKKSRASAKQKELNAQAVANALGDTSGPVLASQIPKDHDCVVMLTIAPDLEKYTSKIRYGLKSRSWETKHDGMSFLIDSISWVPVGQGAAELRGSAGRRQRLKNLVEERKIAEKEFEAGVAMKSLSNGEGMWMKLSNSSSSPSSAPVVESGRMITAAA